MLFVLKWSQVQGLLSWLVISMRVVALNGHKNKVCCFEWSQSYCTTPSGWCFLVEWQDGSTSWGKVIWIEKTSPLRDSYKCHDHGIENILWALFVLTQPENAAAAIKLHIYRVPIFLAWKYQLQSVGIQRLMQSLGNNFWWAANFNEIDADNANLIWYQTWEKQVNSNCLKTT